MEYSIATIPRVFFQGIAGFTLTKTPTNRGPAMFQQAANRAGLRLMQIDLYEGRTVYHDFWTQFSHTRIFVKQKPIGHGVVAHRVIKSACALIGIKDLEAVVEGSHNPNSMIKAFFLGLLRQKTHKTLADEKDLHLLELRSENDFFPKVSEDKAQTHLNILICFSLSRLWHLHQTVRSAPSQIFYQTRL